jgi:hypothetical protein
MRVPPPPNRSLFHHPLGRGGPRTLSGVGNPHVERLNGALVLVAACALAGHGGPAYTRNSVDHPASLRPGCGEVIVQLRAKVALERGPYTATALVVHLPGQYE